MPQKWQQKMWWKNTKNKQRQNQKYQKRKGVVTCFGLSCLTLLVNLLIPAGILQSNVNAESCPDVKIIFARGSGGERWVDPNYLTFKNELESKLELTELAYEFLDLDYPAIGIGDAWTLVTTFVGRGEAYDFGASVNLGVKNLVREINNSTCSKTKFVVAGYSQGAMVVSKAVQFLNADKLIYVATFGDPKIYLPEGAGLMPNACRGVNLSDYRIYVPDCRVYEGMLGSYRPYQPESLIGKMGTWCNHTDIFCSTYFSITSHVSYIADGLYADASKVIFDKITKAFGITNNYVSAHDTVILIDGTASMDVLIKKYKAEALRLAETTFGKKGRVALYVYRDLGEPDNALEEKCNFDTCTYEKIKNGISNIDTRGGLDEPESLLSAGLKVMQKLNWSYGATKSVVVLTDAGYHSPDLDETTFDDVVALSKKIDPVNFYFVVPDEIAGLYEDLAAATDGGVVSSVYELQNLTNVIIARYDSLPRVEEDISDVILPEILTASATKISDSELEMKWNTNSEKVMVILNDYVLGMSEGNSIVISDVDFSVPNSVRLVPISGNRRGASVDVEIETEKNVSLVIPLAPNTGKLD